MLDKIIYGVDTSKEITPLMVRKAIVQCFTEAHGSEISSHTECEPEVIDDKVKREAIELLVVKSFNESGGDFENPTKDSIIRAVTYLKEFSKNFREPEVIEKHASEIKSLINKIK